MALKQPIVLGGSDDLHVPLAGGDTLDPSALTVSNDDGSLLVNSPTDGLGAFFVPQDSQRIAFSGVGSAKSPLSADVIVAAAAGNQLQKLPSGLFAAGLADAATVMKIDPPTGTVFTPTFDKKYQSETFYIYGVNGGEYTLDVSGFVNDDAMSPQYHVRLVLVGRTGGGVIKLTGSYVRTISGTYESSGSYSLPYYSGEVIIYDIYKTPGTAPHVVMAYPFRGQVTPAPALRVQTTLTLTGNNTAYVEVPAANIERLQLYGRTNLRVRCTAQANAGALSQADLNRMYTAFRVGNTSASIFPIFVAREQALAPLSTSQWVTTTIAQLKQYYLRLEVASNTQNSPMYNIATTITAYFEIEAY